MFNKQFFNQLGFIQTDILEIVRPLLYKVSTTSMLEKFNMLSVSQMNDQIQMTEIWKANNVDNYPLKIEKKTQSDEIRTTRAVSAGHSIEPGKTNLLQSTFLSDASRAWNKVSGCIILCKNVWKAKKVFKKFVKNLPVWCGINTYNIFSIIFKF